MRKELLFVLVLFVFSTVITVNQAQAQDAPKVEVGIQYSLFRDDGGFINNGKASGVGGVFAVNFSDYVGADFAIFHFPDQTFQSIPNTNATQGFFGLKTGMRSEQFGIFGKFRPGFVRQSGALFTTDTNFALDIGGVFEVYPARNIGLRFDIGDTIIRTPITGGTVNTNNLQIAAGVMFRF